MYTVVLALHSTIRWIVLVAALYATATALGGWLGRLSLARPLGVSGAVLVAAADLQVLLGLALYLFLSPFSRAALSHPGAAMAEPGLRYWFLEHPLPALAAVALAHVGRVLSRRAPDDATRMRRAALAYGASLLLFAAAVPWPPLPFGRPLWPF